jgi:hypothetical protein
MVEEIRNKREGGRGFRRLEEGEGEREGGDRG